MPRIKLTKSAIDALPTGQSDAVYWDASLLGFGVKVTPKGRKVFVVLYRTGGAGSKLRHPWVGPVVALTYRATVDVPARFRNSKTVGAVFGLTRSKYQSGEIDRSGAISKCGDEMMRAILYEAAHIMLVRSAKWSWLRAWAMQIARRRGLKKAIVALARRLAVIMHRIWVDGTSSGGPGNKPQQPHENRAGSDPIGGNSSSTER